MLKKYTESLVPYVPTILRIMVGVIFFLHGLPKLQNLSGITGFLGSLNVPAPGLFGIVVAILETFGGLALILGIATRWVALLFIVEMIVTTLLVKVNVGFIVPSGQVGVGAELDLLLLVTSLALLVLGAGALSIEQNVLKREL